MWWRGGTEQEGGMYFAKPLMECLYKPVQQFVSVLRSGIRFAAAAHAEHEKPKFNHIDRGAQCNAASDNKREISEFYAYY